MGDADKGSVLTVYRIRRRVSIRRTLAGMALVVLAPPVSTRMASSGRGRSWTQLLDDIMSGRPGVWRLMRGGLAFLAIPGLLVVLALLLLYLYRRGLKGLSSFSPP